jgi:ATP-dependent DNA ligase
LETAHCLFVNLRETHAGRWGYGLTADKMQQCRWLKPQLVALVEFVEWTTGQTPAACAIRAAPRRQVKFLTQWRREDKLRDQIGRSRTS